MTRNLQKALRKQKKSTKQTVLQISGLLGIPISGTRAVEVAGRNGFVYVRLRNNQNEVIQAFNNQVSPAYNLPVIVERQGNRYVVVSVDTQRYDNNWSSYSAFVPRHGNQHSFDLETGGGGDIVWVYPRQFMPLLTLPSGSLGGPNVLVAPYTLKNADGSWKYVGNTGTQDITPYRPSSATGAVMALVYLDSESGNPYLLINSGTVFSNAITGSSQIYSYVPSSPNPNHIPLSAIRLITGTSQISWDNIYDVRQFLHTTPTGTSGGGTTLFVQDEGIALGSPGTLNFVGDNVQVTMSGTVARVFVTGSSGGSGINTGTLDARYLKLDTTNDPLTGRLLIEPTPTSIASNEYGLEVNIDPASPTSVGGMAIVSPVGAGMYVESDDGGNHVVDFEHYPQSGAVVNSSVIYGYRTPYDNSSPAFNAPMIDMEQDRGSGTSAQGLIRYISNGVERANVNTAAQGTGTVAMFDGDYALSPGGMLLLLKNNSSPRFYVNASGTAYSNNVPLVKEAPVDGQKYGRMNSGWELISEGGGGGGDLLIYDDSVFVATGTRISFNQSLNIEATGTSVFVSVPSTLSSYALVQDQKPSGTNAGTFTAGSFVTRDLNTKVTDNDNIISLSSNQMTLTSGTYRMEIYAPAVGVNSHRARLFNATDSTIIALSDSAYAATSEIASPARISTRFTLGGTKALEVQHRCQTTKATYGLGASFLAFGLTEIYTSVEVWKEP